MLVNEATQCRVLSSSVHPIGTTSTALERSLRIFAIALGMSQRGNGSTSILMRTPVLLPRGVLGAPVLLTYPQMGGGC